MMAMAADASDLLSIWGQTLTLMRKTPTYSDTGKATPTWASVASATGVIQPLSGSERRDVGGEIVTTTHNIFLPNGTDARGGDRVRPAGWASGDDEYEVREALPQAPSHVLLTATLVRGHGG